MDRPQLPPPSPPAAIENSSGAILAYRDPTAANVRFAPKSGHC
jgi:hypothetical protein